MRKNFFIELSFCLLLGHYVYGQSPSFNTFMNPVIPGDHPDCTLSRVGNDFYTTGSSFNPTPVIYHSTDLVHWEAIAQPVSAAWSNYGDSPSGGCWGGQMVYHNNKYWDFFSRSNQMYFVTADDIRGTWTLPTLMNCPSIVPGLGYDNSIFIDDDGSWYLLVKNGQVNNWIVQLGDNGQPSGAIYNLCWINPAPSYPYSWAEGPVMWKYKGYYYYSFARNVAGGQIVFRSSKLTEDQPSWVNLGNFFNESDPQVSTALFQNPNHSSAAVTIGDGTSWIVHPLWRSANNSEWYGQGRQGLLNQVTYDANGKATADYPVNALKFAPGLSSSGIPWMVPHSDFFNSDKLNPEWSFLGYTPASSYSLTKRSGWLWLSPKGKPNTILKNDGEHNYSLITRVDFTPQVMDDQAGLQVFNGLQTLYAKLYSTVDSAGNRLVALSFSGSTYVSLNNSGNVVWLKLVRVNHVLAGYWSADGFNWTMVGSVNVAGMDGLQPNYNAWTGNRQGLFVQNSAAYFDFYIYRDAYTSILAECPANQFGTTRLVQNNTPVLDNIYYNDWAMYAGVEFGNATYQKSCDSLIVVASSATNGGIVEVYIDSIDAGRKIAECNITNTGSWTAFKTFSAKLLSPVSGNHDVYLLFTGSVFDKLFMLQSFYFTGSKSTTGTSVEQPHGYTVPQKYYLEQNYPNPFNPTTVISYQLAAASSVTVRVFDLLGREVVTLVSREQSAGYYAVQWDGKDKRGENVSSGVYLCQLRAGTYVSSRKMILVK